MVRLVYEQCLCCFRLHPEVWLSLARYELTRGTDSSAVTAARDVYRRAIECNPGAAVLWAGLAELEEGPAGDLAAAEAVLKQAFQQLPSGFTFALYQRLVRRVHGKAAARKLFTATGVLRSADSKLSYEVSL